MMNVHTEPVYSRVSYFFNFVKAAGIIGIFCFHFYDVYLGENTVQKILAYGILKYLLADVHSFGGYLSVVFQTVLAFGKIGVELFIIASGFGLYYRHLSESTGWITFFKKRFIRIIPLYYLILLSAFLINIMVFKNRLYLSPEGLRALLYHFLLVQNFNQSYLFYGALYFIAIIFQLYLVFPLLTKIIASDRGKLLAFACSPLLSPLINLVLTISGIQFTGKLFTDYLPHFLTGMIIADSLYHSRKLHTIVFDPKFSAASIIAICTAIYLVSYVFDYNEFARTTISFLAFFGLTSVFTLVQRLKLKSLIDAIAYSAYSFYLIHMIFIKVIFVHFILVKGGMIALLADRSARDLYLIPMALCLLAGGMVAAFFLQRGYDRIVARFR